jgi:hypothetical protein
MLYNLICRFNVIPTQIPATYFVDIRSLFTSVHGDAKDPEEPTQF